MRTIRESGSSWVGHREAVLNACSVSEWTEWTQVQAHPCWQTHLQRPGGWQFPASHFWTGFSGTCLAGSTLPGWSQQLHLQMSTIPKTSGIFWFGQSSLYCCEGSAEEGWGLGGWWSCSMWGSPGSLQHWAGVCLSGTFMDTYTLKNPYFKEISHEVCFSVIWKFFNNLVIRTSRQVIMKYSLENV